MARWGLTPELVARPFPEIWEENWPALRLYMRCNDQWRCGMGGPYALDMTVPLALMARMGLSDDDFDELYDDITTMARTALEVMAENRD